MSSTVTIPIKQYAKTEAQLASDNFIHPLRQLVIASDTGVMKLGDGVTAYNSLPVLFNASSLSQTDLQNALNAKQATLVNQTNIKSVNGSSLLGSGDLSVGTFTLPSLTSGSILFSDGSTIAQDNANLFFNNATNRLGIGTNNPLVALHVVGTEGLYVDNQASNSIIKFSNGFGQGGRLTSIDNNRGGELQDYDGSNPALRWRAGSVNIGSSDNPTSKLTIVGSLGKAYVAKTANYTLTINDYLVNCTANSFAITLPTAVGITGREYVIKNTGSGTITLNTTSSQTIDGGASGSITIAQWKCYTLVSDGANWIVTNKII